MTALTLYEKAVEEGLTFVVILFPVVFDIRELRPDMVRFPLKNKEKRIISGRWPLASNTFGKRTTVCALAYHR